MLDLIIIGGGPAGLTAALYAGRAGLKCAIFEKLFFGGQMLKTSEIDNYPGSPEIRDVFAFADTMHRQAEAFGAFFHNEEVVAITTENNIKTVSTRSGDYRAKAVIIATGAVPKKLHIPGEEEFSGRGVSYCATCDGAFFRGKTVAVIGGGDTALEDALFLSKTCEKVYLVHRRAEFRGVKVLSDRVYQAENIELILEAVPKEIRGEQLVNSLVVSQKGEEKELFVNGVFVAIGTKPESGLLSPLLDSDDNGIRTDEQTLMTNTRGIFAAGDVRKKPLRQILTAAADGAQAVFSVQKYLLEEEN